MQEYLNLVYFGVITGLGVGLSIRIVRGLWDCIINLIMKG